MVTPKGAATELEALDTEKTLALGFWKLSVIEPRDLGEGW